jgi:uncharacterized protein (DUF1697 family)
VPKAASNPPLQRYIAFMRALNVGGHTVKMDRLRGLFEEMGFTDVESFIASGNIIFTSPSTDAAALEARIEAHLKAALGYAVATFLRTPDELAAAASHTPFAGADPVPEGHTLSMVFLKSEPGAEGKAKLVELQTDVDEFHVNGRELYWWCRTRFSDSKVRPGPLEKASGVGTNRNVTTVRKLAAKYPPIS